MHIHPDIWHEIHRQQHAEAIAAAEARRAVAAARRAGADAPAPRSDPRFAAWLVALRLRPQPRC